ncbi:MAG: hypothetical protein QM755_03890 [Luteolibacter sp.]
MTSKLFNEFQKRFDKECIKKGQDAFFELRRQDLRTRHEKYSRTVFLQEPNVKESCGGNATTTTSIGSRG